MIAIICSGVGATTFGFFCCSASSELFTTSPGVNVLAGSFLTSSSTSLDANKFSASARSYHPWKTLKIHLIDDKYDQHYNSRTIPDRSNTTQNTRQYNLFKTFGFLCQISYNLSKAMGMTRERERERPSIQKEQILKIQNCKKYYKFVLLNQDKATGHDFIVNAEQNAAFLLVCLSYMWLWAVAQHTCCTKQVTLYVSH